MSTNLPFLKVNEVFFRWIPSKCMSENCIVSIVKHGGGAAMLSRSYGGKIAGDFDQNKSIIRKRNIIQNCKSIQFFLVVALLDRI